LTVRVQRTCKPYSLAQEQRDASEIAREHAEVGEQETSNWLAIVSVIS